MLMGLLETTGQFIFPLQNVAALAFLAFTGFAGFSGNAARHCCLKTIRNEFDFIDICHKVLNIHTRASLLRIFTIIKAGFVID